jgi:polysaccharide chain length determinant protein (PEP-CTERM system associated)
MEELLAQLSTIARSMWRFRWLSVGVAWLVGIAGAVAAFSIPDQFEASSRVFVNTDSILKPLMTGLAVQPNVDQQVAMLSRTLISRPNVEKLVRMADLDLKAQSKAQQDALVTELMAALQIKSVGRDSLYTLAYRDSDAAKAQKVIQSFVSIFIESSLGSSRKDADSAKVFINDQIKAYEGKLLEAETRLKDFRIRNLEMQTSDGLDAVSRLRQLSEQVEQAKLELREAEQALQASRQQIENEKTQSGLGSTTDTQADEASLTFETPEIDSRIDSQKRNLDGLLQRFTEQHPDVVSTRKLIRELENQKKEEIKELKKVAAQNPASVSSPNNIVYQELNKMMANSELQVAALKARVAEYTSRYSQARELLKVAPQIEAEAAQLNRDYEIHKSNYEDLVKRRETAEMSGELDSATGGVDFRLIDPPRVSDKPVSPNRLILLVVAMVAAIASGFVVAFAASQLRPVFHSASDLRSKFDFPLLGIVSMVTSDADHKRGRVDRFKFIVSSGGLVGAFLIGLIGMSLFAARQG